MPRLLPYWKRKSGIINESKNIRGNKHGFGYHHTPEARIKIGIASKMRMASPEVRRELSEAMKKIRARKKAFPK
jgi:hypothetical protein